MHTPTRAHSHMHTHQSDLIPTISTEKKKKAKDKEKKRKNGETKGRHANMSEFSRGCETDCRDGRGRRTAVLPSGSLINIRRVIR